MNKAWSEKIWLSMAQRGRKFKEVQAKKLMKSNTKSTKIFREVAVLNFFPFQKLIFGHF